jgi:hypothetical protein
LDRVASLSAKIMDHHVFQLESGLQNIPEAALEASRRFSVSLKAEGYIHCRATGILGT